MTLNESTAAVEAVLFACGEPVDNDRISSAVGIDSETVAKIIALLNDRYEQTQSPMRIIKLGTAFQLTVKADYIDFVRAAMETKKSAPLSAAAMEVLTIVAYNQPVTKGFIEHIRGTDSSSVVNSLVEKNLLEEAGRLDVPGKPIAYKTTDAFLRCFQLQSLDELPNVPNKESQINFDELLIEGENVDMQEALQ